MNAWTMLLATDAPALPSGWVMQMGLQLSWSVVLAWLGALLVRRWTVNKPVQAGVALTLAAWAWLPGAYSASYWLGLAFQTPSVTAVLVCAALLRDQWVRPSQRLLHGAPAGLAWALAVLGTILGWALLLDTLALLPLQWYAWGFSPAASVLVMLVALLPWVWFRVAPGGAVVPWLVPVAVVVFVTLRLPSGNVWDAVLDPWLWLVMQGGLLRRLYICYKLRSLKRNKSAV